MSKYLLVTQCQRGWHSKAREGKKGEKSEKAKAVCMVAAFGIS